MRIVTLLLFFAFIVTFIVWLYSVNKVISSQQKEIAAKQAIINICIKNAELIDTHH